MGTGHYYFDEMRSSFNLVQNQIFALTKLNKQTVKSQQLHQQQRRKREREIKSP
jgi:hypothetical protein